MKIVSRNSAIASAEQFIPPPPDHDPDHFLATDFAECTTETFDTYLRPLNVTAHRWLLKRGRGTWIQGRLLLPKYRPCRITVEAMNSRFSICWSGDALPPERPQLKLAK